MRRIVFALLLAGCVDRGPGDDPHHVDPAYVQANLLDAPPATLTRPAAAHFTGPGGAEVVYLGCDVAATTIVPGDPVTVTHYWKVVTPPRPDDHWAIFAELRGDGGDYLELDGDDMRTGHPPSAWKAGEVIRDEQSFVVPRDWKSKHATLRLGLYQIGKHRIADRMDVANGDATDRALAAVSFAFDLSKAPPPPGTIILKKATGGITIDGKADEPGWRNAVVNPALDVADGCPAMTDDSSAKMTWDDQYLYFFVSSQDADVWSPYQNHDDELWKADVVEMFIDADANRHGYVELQVNPRNAVFDRWWPSNRGGAHDDSYDAKMVTAVVVRGTLDNRDDGDSGWDAEIAVPWAAARGLDPAMKIHTPPQVGDVWHLNVLRSDMPKDGKQTAASWAKITCSDFHAVERLLNVQFADAQGNIKPVPAPVKPAPVNPPTPPITVVPTPTIRTAPIAPHP